MQLNFRQLEVFRAIMIAKTVSGAAELLHVSQPGISRLLKYTEHKLGTLLFERRKGRLVPTPEGEELFKHLEPIYAKIEGLEFVINRITQNDDLYLQVGCTPSLARYLLPKLLAKAKLKVPGMVIKVDIHSNEELADYIAQRRGDFALSLKTSEHPLVLSEPSIYANLVCVVPLDHELASREEVTFEDIAQHDMVMYHGDTVLGRLLNNKMNELGLSPKMSVLVRFNDDACAMAEHGLGITIALDYVLMGDRYPKLKAIPLKSTQPRLQLLTHNGVSFSHNVRKFYKNFKAELHALDKSKR
jgi:DNA-binding transcriptional LysR family regulator